jgi:hypothetical protein
MPDTDELIDELTTDLRPRRKISPWFGRGLLAVIALLTFTLVVGLLGMRRDFAVGHPHSVPLISALVILSAGSAVAATLTAMARPAVGSARSGWLWALAALAVLPIAAILTAAGDASERAFMMPPEGPPCLLIGSIASIASIFVLTLWLRRGAPTSAARASWLVGISGGTVGAVAMGLVCPIDAITHIGTWHVGIIVIAAVGSRLVLPRFLRW